MRRFRLHPNRHKLNFQQSEAEEDQGESDRLSGTFTFQIERILVISYVVLSSERGKKQTCEVNVIFFKWRLRPVC